MKIALLLPANKWFSPYLKIYTDLFDKYHIRYDVIFWDRDKSESNELGFVSDITLNSIHGKLKSYFQYISFVKEKINIIKYEKIIVFSSQLAICLYPLLLGKYKNKYIIDFRDLSIEQNFILKGIYKNILKNSYCNVISSPGFKKYLPKNVEFILSHNFDINIVKKALKEPLKNINNDKIIILTIGGIRDYESNIEVVKALSNVPNIILKFIGKGNAAERIKDFVNDNNIENVLFSGYYNKSDEPNIIKDATFLNIYYPLKPSHNTALSNRFYNSLIFKKPMIVTKNTVQGDYVDKYKLGLALSDCRNLLLKINDYLEHFDDNAFFNNANMLLNRFIDDYNEFESKVLSFIKNN